MRRAATIALLVAVVLLGLGLLLPWWSGSLEGGSYSIDLRSMEMCLGEHCGVRRLAGGDSGSQLWAKVGLGTFGASAMAALLLVASLFRARGGKSVNNLSWVAAVMCLFSAALGGLFVLLRPEFDSVSPGFGMAACMAGALCGAVAVRVFTIPGKEKAQG